MSKVLKLTSEIFDFFEKPRMKLPCLVPPHFGGAVASGVPAYTTNCLQLKTGVFRRIKNVYHNILKLIRTL